MWEIGCEWSKYPSTSAVLDSLYSNLTNGGLRLRLLRLLSQASVMGDSLNRSDHILILTASRLP